MIFCTFFVRYAHHLHNYTFIKRYSNVGFYIRYSCTTCTHPISGPVDRGAAAETADSGSIPVRIKAKTIKMVFAASLFDVQPLKGQYGALPCVVGRWAGGSLTQRPKGPTLSLDQGNLMNKMYSCNCKHAFKQR